MKSNRIFSKAKRKWFGNVWVRRVILLTFLFFFIFFGVYGVIKLTFHTAFSYYSNLGKNFIFADIKKLKTVDGKLNIVILGKGGQGHEAPDLTDTIMFLSVDVVNHKVRTMSIPRDIWIPELRAKINSAYYWGNKKQPNGGLTLAKSTIEEVVGMPVSYAIVLDFSGFKQIIDSLGGVDVNVAQDFVDPLYPIAGREADLCGGEFTLINNQKIYACRYEKIEFRKGLQHMDGETALKFVRSRHAEGEQGTDLARSERQQKIIDAIKTKIVSKDIITSPAKLISFYEAIKSTMETDLSDENLSMFARALFDARNNLRNDIFPEELLINPPISSRYDNQYVFIPKSGNWNEVQLWVRKFLQ